VHFVFADDARQEKPSRLGAGSFVAIGGVLLDGQYVGPLERMIDQLCKRTGFPAGEQFKWSPGRRDEYMRTVLVDERRLRFYEELLGLARQFEATTTVVIEDTGYNAARGESIDHEHDVTTLFLERASYAIGQRYTDGVVVIAKPGGGPKDDEKFLNRCLDTVEEGTEYHSFGNLPLGVMTVHSRRIRLLQLADVIVSCVVSRVSGEPRYSSEVFELIRPILRRGYDRAGGIGLKLHPEYVYANLYYWLLGDRQWTRDQMARPLPDPGLPFYDHPNEAIVSQELMRQRRDSDRRQK
jgi:hypothetical protein